MKDEGRKAGVQFEAFGKVSVEAKCGGLTTNATMTEASRQPPTAPGEGAMERKVQPRMDANWRERSLRDPKAHGFS